MFVGKGSKSCDGISQVYCFEGTLSAVRGPLYQNLNAEETFCTEQHVQSHFFHL